MCGIVGYIGPQRAVPIIIDGLKRLEYRGYDSAGVAVLEDNGCIAVRRASGKLRNLEDALRLDHVAAQRVACVFGLVLVEPARTAIRGPLPLVQHLYLIGEDELPSVGR